MNRNGEWKIKTAGCQPRVTPGNFCIDRVNQEVITTSPVVAQPTVSVYPNSFVSYFKVSGI